MAELSRNPTVSGLTQLNSLESGRNFVKYCFPQLGQTVNNQNLHFSMFPGEYSDGCYTADLWVAIELWKLVPMRSLR